MEPAQHVKEGIRDDVHWYLQFPTVHVRPSQYRHPPLTDVNLFSERSISDLLVKKTNFNTCFCFLWITWQSSWLRHYATSRKVVGSIPDSVIGFLNWSNASSRTMTLGSTQSLTEMSTRNLPGEGGKGWPTHKADNLTAICEPIA
jgi:hypothetical protein